MSHIPNSAMPHAAPANDAEGAGDESGPTLTERATKGAGKLADKARANPKTVIAAGAAVVAGAIVAAALPRVRAARAKSPAKKKAASSSSSGSSGSAKKKS